MRPAPFGSLSGLLIALSVLAPAPSFADEVEVRADTALQFYDSSSPDGIVLWSRRRLTQTLGLRYVKPLARDPRADVPPTLATHLLLRLDQEFGDTCLREEDVCFAVVNPDRRGSYTPVASNGLLDMPFAYIELRALPYGASVRAGRQLHQNVIGFVRIDGVSARIAPTHLLAFETTFGALVRRTSVAGSDAFVRTGAPRVELDPLERLRAPYIEPEITTYVADGSIDLGDPRVVRGSVSYRALLAAGGIIERRVGAGLVSQPLVGTHLSTHGVLDALDGSLVSAQAGAGIWLAPYSARLAVERHVPHFDASTIWAYFNVAPITLVSLRGSRQLSSAWDVSLALQGRRTELSSGNEDDAGISFGTSVYVPRNELALSGFFWDGGSGPLWGASSTGLHRVTRDVALEAELSVMRIDDPLRSVMQGVSWAELVGARFILTEEAQLRILASHSISAPAGHRLSVLALVHLGAWR